MKNVLFWENFAKVFAESLIYDAKKDEHKFN